ncbi:hypothetical protein [Niabella sp.]|uniref:hypothetical protein n=1 Tax=Niabella sp. TaxID=1962976 RepID=UPI002604BF0E|nr:hypothetical protein [Niabella sp.]
MKHPIKYTFLGFYLNSLVDSGEFISLSDMKKAIDNKTVFSLLKSRYEDRLDISLYTEEELAKLEEFFYELNNVLDEQRKLGIEKNGLCLLVAYCFEALQHDLEKY